MKRLFAIVTMLVALVSACGKRGDPRAPELAAPRTITNLTARSEPKGVALIWSRPTEYVDGFTSITRSMSAAAVNSYQTLASVAGRLQPAPSMSMSSGSSGQTKTEANEV